MILHLKLYFGVSAFLFISLIAAAQPKVPFDSLKAYPVKEINWKQGNFQQILPIAKLFENHKVVILAESTHMDGATLDAQCMIIKQLIDSAVINTLYTESSAVNASVVNQIFQRKGKAGIQEAMPYMFSTDFGNWLENDFIEYLAEKIHDRKLELAGCDVSTTSPFLVRELFIEARNTVSVKQMQIDDLKLYKKNEDDFFNYNEFEYRSKYSSEDFDRHCKFINEVITDYRKAGEQSKSYQWLLIKKFLYWVYMRQKVVPENYSTYPLGDDLNRSKFNSIRDSLMAEIFLQDYFQRPNVKAVIKMSAYHTLKNSAAWGPMSDCCINSGIHTMGDILSDKIGKDMYSICFASSSGEWGVEGFHAFKVKISRSKKSLEGYFRNSESSYFFTDLENAVLKDKIFPMTVVFQKEFEAQWAKIYSGVFFIKKMYRTPYIHKQKHQFSTELKP